MKYLIDKEYNVISTADDEYEYMLTPLLNNYPGSIIVSSVPKKLIIVAADRQPTTNGTQTI